MTRDIVTLPSIQISRFLVRHRRGETLARFQPQLDAFLTEILAKANEFVSSEAGAILLDDPQAKMFDRANNNLTIIAAFGQQSDKMLGVEFSPERGLTGHVYTSGQARRCVVAEETEDPQYYSQLDAVLGLKIRSILGVPVLLGTSICGVLMLANRRNKAIFAEDEHKLIDIFAGYISSTIQTTIDGLRARELAHRDDLTGLYNDRYLHHRLRAEISRAAHDAKDLSLLFIDLDRFKSINDRFGHLEGSRTLHLVGIMLQNSIPENAVAARYGGDEFVIIVPDYNAHQSIALAEQLRRKMESTSFSLNQPGQKRQIYVSSSIGVASMKKHVTSEKGKTARANALIRAADAAMYEAKACGRNRVVLAKKDDNTSEELS